MGTIRIAHISDPHFGSHGQPSVWEDVCTYLNGKLKPHLVLVTGDIVHTPGRQLYRTAREQLDQLTTVDNDPNNSYRVCAGNHDRHPLGNAPGHLKKVWQLVAGWNRAPAWFSDAFQGRIPTVNNPADFDLADENDLWRVRVIGFDTSAAAKFTAQGFATNEDLGGLASAARNNQEADLVILMHHHHLLSIKELEENRQKLKNIFKPTIMLNAGTVLEALAQGYVNVVLHGHEHCRMFARYGTLYGQQNDTIILGAGSVTGNDSKKGCDVSRASFNLIELLPDRTVQVKEIAKKEGSDWQPSSDPVRILDGHAVRRARFYRRMKSALPPTRKIVNCVEFNADRTVDLTLSLSNWELPKGRWSRWTSNNSGIPSAAHVAFEWTDGTYTEFPAQPFVYDDSGMHRYRIDIQLDPNAPVLARRITTRYQWLGGAVLTKSDLAYFDPAALGDFRSRGYEFWYAGGQTELQSTSLLVRLPRFFAPRPEEVKVFCKRLEGVFELIPELDTSVQHHALGVFSLEIPYPRTEYAYALAWPIRDDPPPSTALDRFRRIASETEKAEQLLKAYAGVLGRSSVAGAVTLGLYIPSAGNSAVLTRTGELHRGLDGSKGEVPASLSLRNDNTLARHAWWGKIQYTLARTGDSGFTPGERAIIMIPIRQFGHEDEVTWGLIRIGVYSDGRLSDALLFKSLMKPQELEVFTDGIPMVLHSAAQMG